MVCKTVLRGPNFSTLELGTLARPASVPLWTSPTSGIGVNPEAGANGSIRTVRCPHWYNSLSGISQRRNTNYRMSIGPNRRDRKYSPAGSPWSSVPPITPPDAVASDVGSSRYFVLSRSSIRESARLPPSTIAVSSGIYH